MSGNASLPVWISDLEPDKFLSADDDLCNRGSGHFHRNGDDKQILLKTVSKRSSKPEKATLQAAS